MLFNKQELKVNRDLKIEVSIGCVEYLQEEIKRLRKRDEILTAENRVMESFFNMFDRIGPKRAYGASEDRFWQAQKEIKEAVKDRVEGKDYE